MACVTPMKALRLRLLLWPLSYATLCAVRDRVQGKALAGDRAMALALPAVSRLVEEAGRACGPLPGDAPMFWSVRTMRCGRSEAEDIAACVLDTFPLRAPGRTSANKQAEAAR